MASDFDRDKGEAFRAAREMRGEGLQAAAARLSIAVPYLSRLERGLEVWPEGESSLAADPCTIERAPDNMMDFSDINRTLWMMALGRDIRTRDFRDMAYPWWCKDCGWPLSPMGLHFEIEIGVDDA